MTIKISEPMQNVLIHLADGWGWDDFGVHGPLSYAARVRTCEALAMRGLVAYALGDYDLTEAGESLAKQLSEHSSAAKAQQAGMSNSVDLPVVEWSLAPEGTTHARSQPGDEGPLWLRVEGCTVYWKTPRRCVNWIPSPHGLGELRKPGIKVRPSDLISTSHNRN
ncbi:hypothetical protein NPS53_08200 [Pseudomonas putida]|uniref:hypothetical protein n=1 Tax=Pseudomonas putida TaxID=303 RepID=UPI002364670C|nr:hypothetical protein [Pseudomonas putida]MDD2139552.1 hypothetical protein [Pseudomonas putida]HDS1721475.1 hypothetical protein [Pseudomonas putida]